MKQQLARYHFWASALFCLSLACGGHGEQQPGISASTLPPQLVSAGIDSFSTADQRVRRYIYPRRVLWVSANNKNAFVANADAMVATRASQVTLDDTLICRLRNNGQAPGLLLDFGVEIQGSVQIMVGRTRHDGRDSKEAVHFRVRFGESASEAMSEIGGRSNAGNDHAVRDQVIAVPWLGTVEVGQSGFRFVRLDLLDRDLDVPLVGVRAVLIYRDLAYLGTFNSSDERLNRIWQTGAYTVQLCMQDYVWDGIKRDRLVWIGDLHPEIMTILSVFGKQAVAPASLDLIRDVTPSPKWMNGLSSYSMWWLQCQHDWYLYTGDLVYLQAQKNYIVRLLAELCKCVGPDHREQVGSGRFLDWPSSANKPAVHAGLHALLTRTLHCGAQLCATLADPAMQQTCLAATASLQQYRPDVNGSKQAAALLVLAGLAPAREMNEQVMAVDGAKRMSTFYGYYVLLARAMAGDYQGCLDVIRQYWGGMLDLGATTFWEDFDLAWAGNAGRIDELPQAGKKDIHADFGNYCYVGYRHSFCHGWASGPTAWLSQHVLGITPVEPGFKTVRIEPHLADLQWVEGTMPTPLGLIRVRHEKQQDGTVRSDVRLPPGMKQQH